MGKDVILGISPTLAGRLEELAQLRRGSTVDILVVVDPVISTTLGDNDFGVGKVIQLIRGTTVGCMRFRVDIALRSDEPATVVESPGDTEAKYRGFRFDMEADGVSVLQRYEQVWCFGFNPGNDAGADTNIDQPGALPASDSELAVLAKWMKDRKGGVFATGDHDYLGASMCRRIPRIGTMRRWTNADGVPPIGGAGDPDTAERIDTLRPPTGDTSALGNSPHQEDLTPQPIQWTPWQTVRVNLFTERSRPHPVLCHPTLGPINVMPDHAHEGLCRDTGTVPLDGTYNFDGACPQPEYPPSLSGGPRPEPLVIAYGSTLGNPPQPFEKGEQPYRAKFPMISVYDGHAAGVGRVATDSTWHHWMNINISAMQAENGDNWAKISRYFINLAVWLAPPGYTTTCFLNTIFASNFSYLGHQEYSARLSDWALGSLVRDELLRTWGPCWVSQFVLDLLRDFDAELAIQVQVPPRPGCLTCPPFELLEKSVLGGIVRESMAMAADYRRGKRFGVSDLHTSLRAAAPRALGRLTEALLKDLEETRSSLLALSRLSAPVHKAE